MEIQSVILAQFDHPVEDRLPVPVAGEIVVGDEKPGDSLLGVLSDNALDIIRAAPSRLASLHVDDRAKGALEGTAATGVERRQDAVVTFDEMSRQIWGRLGLQVRKIIQVVVDRLGRTGVNVLQEGFESLLRLAREQRNAEIDRLLQIR